MQPTKAMGWFGPIMVASAIAAVVTIMSSVLVQAQLVPAEAGIQQLFAPKALASETGRAPIVVKIEPSRIEVIGKKRSSVFETLADWLPRRGGAS